MPRSLLYKSFVVMTCLLAAAILFPDVASAAGAGITCHCFRDREYDPDVPSKSDRYLLTTAGNSFLAAAFGVPKNAIVQAKMSGTPDADLWISHYAASRLGTTAAALLKRRAGSSSWKEVFRTRGGLIEPLGPQFVATMVSGGTDKALARRAAAETLIARLHTPAEELDDLITRGASLQEMVLAAFLGNWAKRPAPAIYTEVMSGRSVWSYLLADQGWAPKGMELQIANTIGSPVPSPEKTPIPP